MQKFDASNIQREAMDKKLQNKKNKKNKKMKWDQFWRNKEVKWGEKSSQQLLSKKTRKDFI